VTLHGYRLFSEEVCNEYAAQTVFFQSQAFPTEKSQILSGFKPRKARGVQKSQKFKIWLQKSQIRNPALPASASGHQ